VALHRVLDVTALATGTGLVRISREDVLFRPGQYLLVGLPGGDFREYSIFSRPADPWLEILVRVIPDGAVSRQLASLVPGDVLVVQGPQGGFQLPEDRLQHQYLFVATGTGIAPFHSMIGTFADIDFRLYHGVRYAAECYARGDFDTTRYIACLSREKGSDRSGRVTDVLRDEVIAPATRCYLCGSCDMIYDMFALLQGKGIPREQIHAETYY
jgi:ferredoxin/flavodoxin---NADP+ reductase